MPLEMIKCYWFKQQVILQLLLEFRPVEKGEKGGEVFPGPVMFGGARHHSKILKRVFQMAYF